MAADRFDFEGLVQAGYPLQRFAEGEKIFVDGDEGDAMYAVRSGAVAIMSAGAVLETVQPGETFGELTLIDGVPRGATAIAREPTEVAVIDERAFHYLVARDPLDAAARLASAAVEDEHRGARLRAEDLREVDRLVAAQRERPLPREILGEETPQRPPPCFDGSPAPAPISASCSRIQSS